MKKNSPRSRRRRPTATLNLKAKEVKTDEKTKSAGKDAKAPETNKKAGTTDSARQGKEKEAARSIKDERAKTGSINGKPSENKSSEKEKLPEKEKDRAKTDRSVSSGRAGKTKAAQHGSSTSPSPKSGGGFFSHLFASVLGAGLGILGLSYANHNHMLPPALQIAGDSRPLEQKINALSGKLAQLEHTTTAPDGLSARLADLSTQIRDMQASLGDGTDGAPRLTDRLNRVETAFAQLEQAAKTGKGGRLAGLTAVSKQLKKSNRQALELKNELIKVREEQNSFREDLASLRSKQVDFISKAANISDQLARLKTSTAQIVAKASQPPDVSQQIKPVMNSLAALTAKIDGVINREAQSRAEGRNIALALSLGELKRAINEGIPYKAELARLMPHAPSGLDLSVLSQHAANGLVTLKKLQTDFRDVSNRAMSAEQVPNSGSFVDQLVSSAKNMVQVRPTGFVKGNTTGAIIARMEYRLAHNDLAGALKESEALSGKAAKAMAPWLEQARARAKGLAVLRGLEDRIRNALAGAASGKG